MKTGENFFDYGGNEQTQSPMMLDSCIIELTTPNNCLNFLQTSCCGQHSSKGDILKNDSMFYCEIENHVL